MKRSVRKVFYRGIIALVSIFLLSGCNKADSKKASRNHMSYERLKKDFPVEKNVKLTVWYQKEEEEQFLLEAAEAFEEKYSIEVESHCVKKTDYLKEIALKSKGNEAPDLYFISNGQLQQAKQYGIAKQVEFFPQQFLEENYPKTAINAGSLQDGVYGYPLYFDTYFLLYHSEDVRYAPTTFDEMIEYGEQLSDKKDNTNLFKWDLTDPYTNFMFLGDSMELFGDTGDDTSLFKINNYQTIEAMKYFQELNNLPIGTMKTVDYETVLSSIEHNEAVFAICETDAINRIPKNSSYKVALLPDLTDEIESNSLSITELAVVNEQSKQQKAAELFASYLSYEFANQQYDTIGRLSAKKGIFYEDERLQMIYRQYEKSMPIPKGKVMEYFWNYMRIANENIWNGATVSRQMDEVQKKMEHLLSS